MKATSASKARKKSATRKPAKPAMPPWIVDVAERLSLVRDLLAITGDDAARYSPRDPMSEAAVVAFEGQHGVALPADYRDLLVHLGTGIGDDSGILPLAPFTPTAMPAVMTTITSTSGITARASTPPRPASGRAADMAKPFDASTYDGCLELVDLGCGYSLLLAITGPRAGTVWEDTTAAVAGGGIATLGPFRAWLDQWLDRDLAWAARSAAAIEGARAALTAAADRIEAIGAGDSQFWPHVAHVRLALGDRDGALSLLDVLPTERDRAGLRERLYATEIADASQEPPAEELAQHGAREVRLALATNPSTPSAVVDALTRDADSEVRSRAARHANAAPDVLGRVARDGLAAITRGELGVETAMLVELAVRNAAAPPALVEEAATAALDLAAARGVATSRTQVASDSLSTIPSTTGAASDLRVLAIILRGVALAPACPPALRAQLASSIWPEVRHAVAACRLTLEPELRTLATDDDAAIRIAVATRRDAPPEVLHALASDPNDRVRDAVADNPAAPPAAIASIIRVGDALFYAARNPALPPPLVAALAHLIDFDEQAYEPQEEDAPAIRAWVDECDVDNHASTIPAADAMAAGRYRHWSYPVAALDNGFDGHMGPYEMAARPWLTAELVERLSRDRYAYARGNIAGRAEIDERVLARLAADPSHIVRKEAAANPRLAMHELLGLVEDPDDSVREAVAKHPALPVMHRARLVGDRAPYVRRGVARSPNVSLGELARLAADKSDDVRRWIPWSRTATPALLAAIARDDKHAQTRGRAAFRIAVEAVRVMRA